VNARRRKEEEEERERGSEQGRGVTWLAGASRAGEWVVPPLVCI